MTEYLSFEDAIKELDNNIKNLEALIKKGEDLIEKNPQEELEDLKEKRLTLLKRLYRELTPWQKVQVARHQARPQTPDYIENIFTNYQPLYGDRLGFEDKAIIGGLAKFNGKPVMVLGTQKGKNTKQRMEFRFGMPSPEGYRKSQRLMMLADKFKLPIITFVDTPGAFPGLDAEARGQAQAIATSIEVMLNVNVPIISVITGEGGSGGALAIATADKVLMLEHSIYSVISPEGGASILWRSSKEAKVAAEALKITAQDLEKLKVIDGIIKEPAGGAHRVGNLYQRVEKAIAKALASIEEDKNPNVDLKISRRQKYLNM